MDLNKTVDQLKLSGIYKILHPTTAGNKFFSIEHGTFFRIDYMLDHKIKLFKFWKIKIISSVQLLGRAWLFVTPWTTARQASLSIINSRRLFKLMSIESVMPSKHLILCHPLLFLSSVFPSIRVFSNELVLHISWPKYWSFNLSISSLISASD